MLTTDHAENPNVTPSCGVRACLEWEQHHLDATLHEVELLLEVGALRTAATRLDDFQRALEHHVDVEERVPMPAFECALGMPEGPTVEMHAEHDELRELARTLAADLARADEPRAATRLAELRRALDHHNAKDVAILYRVIDKAANRGVAPPDLAHRIEALGACHASQTIS